MRSKVTEDYIRCFNRLPDSVKAQTRKSFRFWKNNPSHPSLRFKRIHANEGIYAVRVARGWRALGLRQGDTMTWFWIGSHAEYDQLIKLIS